MAWEWSHTNEAYAAANRNLGRRSREWLEVVFAEWRAAQRKGEIPADVIVRFDERKYNRALAFAKTLDDESLCDAIWVWMSEWRTCTAGGYQAYACPYGCECHLLPFDDEPGQDVDKTDTGKAAV